MASILDRVRRVVNAFVENEPESSYGSYNASYGAASSGRPDRTHFRYASDKTIVAGIYTRIAIDVASIEIKHVRLDDQDRYLETIDSGLNNCLTVEANVDQAGRALRQDIAMSLCDDGVLAIVPVETSLSPKDTASYDILNLRVGKIVAWYPQHVKVSLYNEAVGRRQEIVLPKRTVAIVENPLYAVMNEPNSTLQRLIHKLALLDAVEEQSASGKLDLIIQLPYVVKSEARKQQAESRRKDIEVQLKGSQYGIAYTDGTEKITQLNRPAENNLLKTVEYLTTMLYGQLGITPEILNGTADEKTILNYWNRTIEPIVDAIVEAMIRVFLTKTARSQKQSILYFRDPFKLMPIDMIADVADKLTRNEIATSNEIRQKLGMKPSSDPKADQLINSNMPQGDTGVAPAGAEADPEDLSDDPGADEEDLALDDLESQIDDLLKELGEDPDADA